MELWIVGKLVDDECYWEFAGVYDSEEKALEACKGIKYFIGPAVLNNNIPDETTEWEGAYYPLYKFAQNNS